jgi:hypothetical protein
MYVCEYWNTQIIIVVYIILQWYRIFKNVIEK